MSVVFATAFLGVDNASVGGRFVDVSGGLDVGAYGRFSRGVKLTAAGQCVVELPAPLTTFTVGVSVKPVSAYLAQDPINVSVLFVNSSRAASPSETLIQLIWRADLEAFQLLGPEPTQTSFWVGAAGSAPAGTWAFLELKATISATSGALELVIDGVTAATLTGLNTRGLSTTPDADYIGVGGYGVGEVWCDAIYVTDTAGTAPHNGYLGPCRADPLTVNAASSTDWTPAASTNLSQIDDGNAPDDDVTYVSTIDSGDRDLFTVNAFSAPTAEVLAYVAWARGRATANDGRAIRAVHKEGSANVGSDATMYVGYRDAAVIVPEDPTRFASTGAASTAISAMLIGYEAV